MIVELILAALALSAAGGVVAAYRRRHRQEQEETPPALMEPRRLEKGELKANDVIVSLGTDYLVEAVATFHEGGSPVVVVAWVTDGESTQRFIVDLKEQPRCVLAKERDASDIGRSIPRVVHDNGLELRLARRAALRVTCEGECDLPPEGACDVGVYRGPGDRKAVMLLSEGCHLFFVGRGVTEEGLQLLQGDLTTLSTR